MQEGRLADWSGLPYGLEESRLLDPAGLMDRRLLDRLKKIFSFSKDY